MSSIALKFACALFAVSGASQDEAGETDEARVPVQSLDQEVSGYPEEHQEGYRLFRSRCSTCHTTNRALSAEVEDWRTKVRKMRRKQGSAISPAEGKRIAAFLNYASQRRRGDVPQEDRGKEMFPRWQISGALFTGANGLVSKRGSRDTNPEEGIVGEFWIGGDAAFSRNIAVKVSACYGCHQLEVDQAYVEYEFCEGLRIRLGRFPVPVGGFSQRYLSSHRESASKPLPYIMGMMPRAEEFNQGVLPAPLVDNGASLGGEIWPLEGLQLGAEIYAVRGLKGEVIDFNYITSRRFQDNNGEPAGGARLTASWNPLSVGISYTRGAYDSEGDLDYQVIGADVRLKLGEVILRAEYLYRETDYLTSVSTGAVDSFEREGYYVQIDAPLPIVEGLRVFVLQDGLSVQEIFLSAAGPTAQPSPATTDDRNSISRVVLGLEYSPVRRLAFKGSAEWWDFSDFDDAWVFHVGAVFVF